MAYTPTEWVTGDTITAEKLNKLEQGIASSAMEVVATFDNGVHTLNKTWQEIYDAFPNVYISFSVQGYGAMKSIVSNIMVANGNYTLETPLVGNDAFTAESADDYPTSENPK